MILQSLSLRNFRSYQQGSFEFLPESNIIFGDNGKGKTNLLEAILMLTGGRSWRAARKSELVHWDEAAAFLCATVHSGGREKELRMELPASGRTNASVNGVKIKRQYDLAEHLRCVLFSPEDLTLVKGAASGRRAFIDDALCQLRPRYGEILSRYQKLLESKSKLLKTEENREAALSLLPEYDFQLCRYGAALISYRARFLESLNHEAKLMHSEISGGKEYLTVGYQTVKTVKDPFASEEQLFSWLMEHMESHRKAEEATMQCLSGIHKDEMPMEINGRDAKAFASQGQTRSAALSLKFGLREMLRRDSGEYPILLLDDVLSELDSARQAFVAQHAMGGQSIITCCEGETSFGNAHVIRL